MNPYLESMGMSPVQVANDPYMANSNPLMDFLVAHYMKTGPGVNKPGKKAIAKGDDKFPKTKNRMREVKGPIKAKTAHRIADKRDAITKEIP